MEHRWNLANHFGQSSFFPLAHFWYTLSQAHHVDTLNIILYPWAAVHTLTRYLSFKTLEIIFRTTNLEVIQPSRLQGRQKHQFSDCGILLCVSCLMTLKNNFSLSNMAAKQVLHYLFTFSIHASAMNSPLTINILLINPWHAVNH